MNEADRLDALEKWKDSVERRFEHFDSELAINTAASEEARDVSLRVETNTKTLVELFTVAKWNARFIAFAGSLGIGGGALLWLRDHIK